MPIFTERVFLKFRLNWRLIRWLALCFILVAVPTHFLHRYQNKRLAETYLLQANLAEKDSDYGKLVKYLSRYIRLRPQDSDASARLGRYQARFARTRNERIEAFLRIDRALILNPESPTDLRMLSIQLALHPTVDRFEDAERQLKFLLEKEPGNAYREMLYGNALKRGKKDFDAAELAFLRAIELDPALLDAYYELAWLRREWSRKTNAVDGADRIIEQLLKANAKNAEAHLIAADYWKELHQTEKFEKAVDAASQLDPDSPRVLAAKASVALSRANDIRTTNANPERRKYHDSAFALLSRAIELITPQLPPNNLPPEPGSKEEKNVQFTISMYRSVIEIAYKNDQLDEAEKWVKEAKLAFPQSGVIHYDAADLAIRKSRFDEASELLSLLENEEYPIGLISYQRGRILVARKQWRQACRMLERATEELAILPSEATQAFLLLAFCYEQTGETDRRYEAYRRAIPSDPLDPRWFTAVKGVAETYAEMGLINESLAEYRRLADRSPDAYAPLARLMMLEAMKVTTSTTPRNWTLVEELVQKIPDKSISNLLQAELAMIRGDSAKAREILENAVTADPLSSLLWWARVALEVREQKIDRAWSLVQEAETKLGDVVDVRLMKSRMIVDTSDKQAVEKLMALTVETAKFTPEDRQRLFRNLVAVARKLNRRDLARTWLGNLLADRPDDIGLQFQLFDLAMLDNEPVTMLSLVNQVVQTSGSPNTTSSRVIRAFYLVWKANQGDRTVLDEATVLLEGIDRQRGSWASLYVAKGRLADLQGNLQKAASMYQLAVDRGERSDGVINRLMELYYELKMFAAADLLIRQLPDGVDKLTGAKELMAELSLGAKSGTRAIKFAEEAVPANSADARKLLWKARVYISAGDVVEAEKPLRRAIEVGADKPETWIALVQYLSGTERKAEAAKVLEQAKLRLSTKDIDQVLAIGYEVIGDMEKSRAVHQELVLKRGTEVPILRSAADFYLHDGKIESARPILERILEMQTSSDEDKSFARRLLSRCLASTRDYQSTRKAMQILGLTDVSLAMNLNGTETTEDIRSRIFVLVSHRGRKSREAAAKLLELLERKAPLDTRDQFLLAQLQQALGDWPKARTYFLLSAKAKDSDRGIWAVFAATLLLNKDLTEAKIWIDQLAKAEPDSIRTIELQSRLAALEGREKDAVELIRKYAQKTKQYEISAALMERLNQLDEAKLLYQSHASDTSKAVNRMPWIGFLARTGELPKAIQELTQIWEQLPIQAAMPSLCQILLSSTTRPDATLTQLINKLAADGVRKKPEMLVFQSMVQSLLGDYPSAIASSRTVLKLEPNNALAMNNLAFLLSLHEQKHDEALELIRRATQSTGPDPSLIDTEALILIQSGKYEAAIDILREATIDDPTGVSYFHMALAYQKLNKLPEALISWKEAKNRNIRLTDFHPLEYESFQRFKTSLNLN